MHSAMSGATGPIPLQCRDGVAVHLPGGSPEADRAVLGMATAMEHVPGASRAATREGTERTMEPLLLLIVLALAALVATAAIRLRLAVPASITLVLIGGLIAAIPGLPLMAIDPSFVLLCLLPPLLYSDAFAASWIDFRRSLRPIVQMAVMLVAATILVVGVTAKLLFPEWPWAACFILGAIVSPTDTVAAQELLRRLRLPRRMTAIIGGESLINDATGLVGVQIGVTVVMTGTFAAGSLVMDSLRVSGLGIGIGLGVGTLFAFLNQRLRGSEGIFALSFLAPYSAMLIANLLGSSGILAVIIAGFVVSWRIHHLDPGNRRDLMTSWRLLTTALNGISFFLIGYAALPLLRGSGMGLAALGTGLVVAAVVVALRIAWIFLSQGLAGRAERIPWQGNIIIGWCGMRGLVSLAAALSVPALLPDGGRFPGREQMIGITLVVIAVTLFAQGLTLRPLIRLLGIPEDGDVEAELHFGRERLLTVGIERLDALCSERECPAAVQHLRLAMGEHLTVLRDEDTVRRKLAAHHREISGEILAAVTEAQKDELLRLRHLRRINDQTALRLQLELDRGSLR